MVAEGIEHPGQLALLGSIGCEYGQGHLFARPMDAAAADPAIAGWDASRHAAGVLPLAASVSRRPPA